MSILSERDEPPVDEILQAPGRGDEDVGVLGLLGLPAERHAAVDRHDPQAACRGRGRPELLGHLGGELTGRHEHERGRRPRMRAGAFDEREPESERLSGPGRGLRQHVRPGDCVGQHELLDRKR